MASATGSAFIPVASMAWVICFSPTGRPVASTFSLRAMMSKPSLDSSPTRGRSARLSMAISSAQSMSFTRNVRVLMIILWDCGPHATPRRAIRTIWVAVRRAADPLLDELDTLE